MKLRKLGSSDLMVPMCCLGTMTWGQQNTKEDAFEQLDYALAHGVNFIDTAELYPVPPRPETCNRTELYIGEWIESRGVRDKIILATKVAGPWGDAGSRSYICRNRYDDESQVPDEPLDLTATQIKDAVAASLRRLRTHYVDLIQLHWPSRYAPVFGTRQYRVEHERPGVPFEEQVKAVGELIAEGKVRHWGLSNETTYGVIQMCETAQRLSVPPPVSIQNDFSLVYRHFETELAEACSPSHYNIGLLSYGALAGGTLSGKYLNGQKPPSGRHTVFPKFQPRYYSKRTLTAAAKYAELAKKVGVSPTTLALAWCASRWYMGSVIIGATTMAQLKEDIAAFEVELDEDTLKAIDAIHMECRNPNCND